MKVLNDFLLVCTAHYLSISNDNMAIVYDGQFIWAKPFIVKDIL